MNNSLKAFDEELFKSKIKGVGSQIQDVKCSIIFFKKGTISISLWRIIFSSLFGVLFPSFRFFLQLIYFSVASLLAAQ
jgi:hypothetical protein